MQRSTATAQDTGPAGETQVPDSVRDVISSSGRSLDTSIQRAVEDRMGDSLGDVRIHTGPKAAQACDQINARAFTVGNHVAFNAGEYDPSSPEGQHVLAHELAHVRQQTGGAVSMLPQEDLGLEIDPDPQLEREAEETAQRVMQGGELGVQRL
ncbi:eCIS core domain-containing protein, partial [Natrinema altunense]